VVAPLTFEKDSSEAMVVLARAGIPIAPMTMVLGGTTAPVTLVGTLAVGNAEELAAIVIVECANPGAPLIYTSEAAPADMKTGEINYKAPEYPLLSAGAAQMTRFYEVPSLVADISLEEVDAQTDSVKITIEGTNIDYEKVKTEISDCGAVIHSIDGVSAGMKLVDEVNTPQDR